MDRGLYPTYFMHMEREDGKRVSVGPGLFPEIIWLKGLL